eukprot:scaffold12028_cov53-Phaeocystis_antarctica.AAC.4
MHTCTCTCTLKNSRKKLKNLELCHHAASAKFEKAVPVPTRAPTHSDALTASAFCGVPPLACTRPFRLPLLFNMGAGVPGAGDNVFLFASREGQASQPFRVYQRGESLPDPSFPDTETRSSQPLSLALPLCPHLPPRQQIRHARPAQRRAARGASLYTGDASLGRRVALWQREWRPGVWWHIRRREGGTSGGVARWHQMDDEGSEEGPRASSNSIWEYPKLTTTSRPLELDRLMVEEPAYRRGPSAQGNHVNELPLCRRSRSCRAAPSQALSLVKPRQRKHVINAGAMLEVRVLLKPSFRQSPTWSTTSLSTHE